MKLEEKIALELVRLLGQSQIDPYNRKPLRFIKPQKAFSVVMEDVLEDSVQAILKIIKKVKLNG